MSATRFAGKKPSPYKIEQGVGEGDSVDQSGKAPSCVCGLHGVVQPGVSNKKFRQRSGTPLGRQHATTLRNLVIPAHKGE